MTPERPRKENVLEDSVEPLVQLMIGAFQHAADANIMPASKGLPLEHLRALGDKEFVGVRRPNLTKVEY